MPRQQEAGHMRHDGHVVMQSDQSTTSLDRLRHGNSPNPWAGRRDVWRGVALALILIGAVWFTQRPLSNWTSSSPGWNLYLIQPLLWSGVGVLAWYVYSAVSDAPRLSTTLVRVGLIAGVFHLSVIVLSGLVVGFADNPAIGRLANYPKNLLYFTTFVVGVEMGRAAVFHSMRQQNERLAYVVTTVVMAVVFTPVGEWSAIHDLDSFYRIGVGKYLPALVLSAVATSFVADGGLFMSAAYHWPVLALQWLVPILPAYDWSLGALVGIAVPLASLVVARMIYEGSEEWDARQRRSDPPAEVRRSRRGATWGATALMIVVIGMLTSGVFGIRPYLLTGISMEPGFGRGDVVLIREAPAESLEVNDIIRFRLNSIDYVHRIIDVYEEDGGLVFVTKGDNVDLPDPPVPESAVTGKVVFVIPKVGLPSLWIREALS